MDQLLIGQFCWNQLSTPSLTKAKYFYSSVLNWHFKEIPLENGTYTTIQVNGLDIGGIWQVPEDLENPAQSSWTPFVLVSDVVETLEKAKQHGATPITAVTDAGKQGKFAIILDPTGAKIALWEAPQ